MGQFEILRYNSYLLITTLIHEKKLDVCNHEIRQVMQFVVTRILASTESLVVTLNYFLQNAFKRLTIMSGM